MTEIDAVKRRQLDESVMEHIKFKVFDCTRFLYYCIALLPIWMSTNEVTPRGMARRKTSLTLSPKAMGIDSGSATWANEVKSPPSTHVEQSTTPGSVYSMSSQTEPPTGTIRVGSFAYARFTVPAVSSHSTRSLLL